MSSIPLRRAAASAATAAALLGGSLAAAPAASADSPVETREKHRLSDGCFTATYDDDAWASQTLYFHNRCKRAHRLKVTKIDGGESSVSFRVSGHTWGKKRFWNYSGAMVIEDMGRA